MEGKGWCAAAELEDGDVLRTQDGETDTVKDVQIENLDEAVKVYNLEIEDYHTYYVSEDSVLVHNEGCGRDNWGPEQQNKIQSIIMLLRMNWIMHSRVGQQILARIKHNVI